MAKKKTVKKVVKPTCKTQAFVRVSLVVKLTGSKGKDAHKRAAKSLAFELAKLANTFKSETSRGNMYSTNETELVYVDFWQQ
jgi:hypothetical protein